MSSMVKHAKKWFAPPERAGSEERSHRLRLLNVISLGTVIFAPLIFVFDLIFQNPSPILLVINLFTVLIFVLLRYLLRRGRAALVSIGLLVAGFLFITASTAARGTVSSSIPIFLLLVVIAGMLYQKKGTLLAAAVCSLAGLGLILAERAGLLPQPEITEPFLQWLLFTLSVLIAGGLSLYSYRSTVRTLLSLENEIKKREEIEVESQKLLRAVEQSPASIVITDLNGSIEYVNPRFTEVTGYSAQELIGKNPRILKTDMTGPETHRSLWKTIREGKEWRGEFANRKKDGSLYFESAVITPITDRNGVVTNYLGVKEDITERKVMEEALLISEGRFRSLFEQTHDAVFILDLEGSNITTNQRAAEMLGYTLEDMTYLSMAYVSVNPDNTRTVLSRLLAGEHIPLFETLFRKKDGHIFPVEISIELIKDNARNNSYIQSVVRDISERKQAEEALRNANLQLIRSMSEVQELQAELREQALRDPLTGLFNRRFLDEVLQREIIRCKRENTSLSIIIADLDRFKLVNDTYGHQVGDQVLVKIAQVMKKYARASDTICRFGGEEFLLVMPGMPFASAVKRADEIRQICSEIFISATASDLKITISMGVAAYPDHGDKDDEIIMKADKALYQSKTSGRNRVTAYVE